MKEEYSPGDAATAFFKELKQEVELYFSSKQISSRGNNAVKIKTFGLFFFYLFACFLLYMVPASNITVLVVYALMGFASSLVMVNISHDAAHEAIFESHFWNRFMSYTFNLVGSNEYFWRLTHNRVHHPYPNVPEIDPDIDQGPLIRLSPAVPWYGFHRFQHYYAPLLYGLFSLYLVFIKDFRLLFGMERIGHIQYHNHPLHEIIILFASKIIFIAYILVLPILFLPVSWAVVVAGYLLYSFIQSTILTVLTAPVHVTEDASFGYRYEEEKKLAGDWVARQVETTTDFIIKNPGLDFFLGGANYQVIHHLFPQISHAHFRNLTAILQESSRRHHIRYMRLPLWEAYKSHLKRLRYFGRNQG